MHEVAPIAFATEPQPGAAVEVRVNFGIFAGRDVTNAEIDELAQLLLPEVPQVSIVAEERHAIDREAEASVHQVRIEIADEALPAETDAALLGARVVALAERWADSCISDRHAEVSEGS
ncbi:MAG: hypothetical protein K0T00_378 [Gaiellaceae bacterium]|nr:hypothetical protein [Gaiellaceae bacterium]